MSNIKYIGRTTNLHGKTLWEIVGSLPDFGVGRLVIRNVFQRYPQPCYMRILKVQAVPEGEGLRKVRVIVEKTWRGITSPNPVEIYSVSYKPDYELVPKKEEAKYLNNMKTIEEKILKNNIELPPLLSEFISKETNEKNPVMKVHFKKTHNKFVRLAKDDEQPTLSASMGLGKPTYETLYEKVL